MSRSFPTRKLVKVADAYRHGATYAEIKKKFGASDGTVRRACQEFGVKMRGRGNHTTTPATKTPVAETQFVLNTALRAANDPVMAETLLLNIGCRFLKELEQFLGTKLQIAEARFEPDGRTTVRYMPRTEWKEVKGP